LFSLGTLYAQRQEREKATTLYRRLLAAQPRHAGAHYQLGKILLGDGKVDEAIEHLEKSVEAQPALKGAHYQLARAYRQRGQVEKADQEAETFRRLGTEQVDDESWRQGPVTPERPPR